MKKIILVGAILSTVLASAQQGIGTNLPDKSSALELKSTKRGLLIPRVPLEATNVQSPVTTPANSLLVYNTETAGAAGNKVTPGYYYWDDTAKLWIRLINDADLATVATEAATKSVETVTSGDANIVEVAETGGPLNKNYAVKIKPAAGADAKVLKSTNGTIAWEDASTGGATLDAITGNIRVVSAITEAEWAVADTFALVQTSNAQIRLPNPANYSGKIIAVNNQYNNQVTYYITNKPANTSTLNAGKGHILMSTGTEWYIIGGSY